MNQFAELPDSPALMIDPEFQALIPPHSDDERQGLEASILEEGCRDPIGVCAGHNIIVDGHTRYAICKRHGLSYKTLQHEFDSRAEVIVWMLDNQLARRNVPPFVRGELALRKKAALSEKAKANMSAGGKVGADMTNQGLSNLLNPVSEPVNSQREMAAAAAVSQGTLHKIQTVSEKAPEPIKQQARTGDMSPHRAYQITQAVEVFPEGQRELIAILCDDNLEKYAIMQRLYRSMSGPDSNRTYEEILRTGGFHHGRDMEERCDFRTAGVEDITKGLKSIADGHRHEAGQVKRAQAFERPAPQGKYKTIVIDPLWPEEKAAHGVQLNQGPYPTMTLDEIRALNIRDLAFDGGCHLYIWTPHQYLPDTIDLVRHWGFRYECVFTWVKPTGNPTFSWMENTAFVVFARFGALELLRSGLTLSLEAPAMGHAIKPDVFYEERVIPASPGPRLEMFARREREGFEVWGDAVQVG